jgi:hypothetical protein
VVGFVAGAAAGGVGAEPRTVTVTSIVTSIVPASTTGWTPSTRLVSSAMTASWQNYRKDTREPSAAPVHNKDRQGYRRGM